MPEYGPYRHIDVTVADGVATITIDRPATHNALNAAVLLDLDRAFAELRFGRDVDAVVLTGAGEEAFSAGADLAEYAGPAADHDPSQRERQERFHRAFRAPLDCPVPVVAKVDGYCVGGGLVLAAYCDLRVASADAEFGLPTAAVGLLPTGGACRRLTELVGEAVTKELVFTAERIDAERAQRVGLVNDVVPPAELDERVADLVASMRAVGQGALERSKAAIDAAVAAPDAERARETEARLWWEQFRTTERRERVREFLE